MNIHEDTLQGLKEALEYVKGDKTKGRSMLMAGEIPDTNLLLFQKIEKLSEPNKQRVVKYVDELLKVTG